jgi:uncharacterized protein (TIGR02598 family)
MRSPGSKLKNAFSLVEVSLSLAIVGIAFTVIIGMLPVGLRQARAATDTTNEARILSGMTAIVLATEYEKISELEKKIHYFDADGGFLESEESAGKTGGGALEYKASHVYQAMVLASDQPEPGGSGKYDPLRVGRRVHIAYGRITPKLVTAFQEFTSPDEAFAGKKALPFKVAPVVLAKMDRVKTTDIP